MASLNDKSWLPAAPGRVKEKIVKGKVVKQKVKGKPCHLVTGRAMAFCSF
jgi:hypothetical protein